MRAYQMTGRGGGVRESAVKWSGKIESLSGKSQGISFQTKSGHPVIEERLKVKCSADQVLAIKSEFVYFGLLQVAIRSFSIK